MFQSEPPHRSESNSRRRTRRPSPSDQSRPRKRQRQARPARFSPPLLTDRPQSATSTATSIDQYYGIGDEDALRNLFASYPQTFSSFPRPHGSQGLHEPPWELRFDHEIYLSNNFPPGRTRSQRVRIPIPGPKTDLLLSSSPPQSTQRPPTATRADFKSALKLVREVIGEEKRLTIELARSYERAIKSSPFQQSSSPTPDPIPNPPIPGDAAPSAEVLFNWVNAFAKAHGFGIIRRNAYSYKGRKIRYSFQCDRFGEPRPTEGVGIRQRKSRKYGYKWIVVAEALEEDKWLLRQHSNPKHSQHNHGRSIGPSAHPSHRRLTTPIRATVESTSRRVGIRARDVRAVVQEQHPESVFTRKDIYNARSLINRDKFDGYTPTAALIKLFDEREIPYLVKWADDNPNRLLGLVWTFPYCLQMWKWFISFDNTYNTNRFKLPLFQATGTDLPRDRSSMPPSFLSESIRQLTEQQSIRQPDVIITDFDDSMKAALNDQFPEAQQQLCIHHINSNVLLRSKQKWVKDCSHDSSSSSLDSSDGEAPAPQTQADLSPKDRQFIHAPAAEVIPHSYRGVLMMWKLVLFAETEEAHEKAWWARCFIREYRNFGIRVTSGTEASNNNVKSYLLNGMSHLYRLVEAMQDMIRDQERDFTHASAEDEVLTAREYLSLSSEYLGELRASISSKGLGLITKQYRLARKAMSTGKNPFPDPLGDCSEDCSVSVELGIPCCHKIYSKIGSGTPFTKWDVHPRWRLRESASRDPYRRILDPKIATALRASPVSNPPVSQQANQLARRQGAGEVDYQGVGTSRRLLDLPWKRANGPVAGPVPHPSPRHAVSQLLWEMEELQGYVPADGGRNQASGGEGEMGKDSGHALTELAVDGGMCNSDLIMQTQADLIGVPVNRPGMRETTALGAAIAARLAVGVWEDF
ncbi:hypothetical protein MRS44_013941 [Fusarium solani]|uniref:uncharacterized protein n=1 Tax=Fusarium solani TaxID=169388 RepID=UPI0032C3F27A|nr:hypothetical protein MRS44_013941 [Fusarium solani]